MAIQSLTANRRTFLSAVGAAGAISALPAIFVAEANPRAAWDSAIAKLQAFEVAFEAHPDPDDDMLDAWGDTVSDVMKMPAPDRRALRWKLDRVLEIDADGYTTSFSRDYVEQTIADCRRLMGDA